MQCTEDKCQFRQESLIYTHTNTSSWQLFFIYSYWQLLKCDHLLLFFLNYYSNVFGFGTLYLYSVHSNCTIFQNLWHLTGKASDWLIWCASELRDTVKVSWLFFLLRCFLIFCGLCLCRPLKKTSKYNNMRG